MNKNVRQNYEQMAQNAGLQFDAEGGALYGQRGGFDLMVYAPNTSYPYMLAVSVSAQRPGNPLTKEEGKQFKNDNKPVAALAQSGNILTMSLKNKVNQSALQDDLNEALNAFVYFLRAEGFQNCCQTCGKAGKTAPCCFSGSYLHLCSDCFVSLQQRETVNQAQKKTKNENLIGGVVGALIGSLLGVACIIILSQLGYVAALSGIVMAVCTLKGYEMLGGKLTKKGIVVSIILMLVMTFVGDQADWAIVISREFEVGFVEAFRAIPVFLQGQIIEPSSYWGNLVMLYGFLLLGAVPTINTAIKNRKNEDKIYCLEKNTSEL